MRRYPSCVAQTVAGIPVSKWDHRSRTLGAWLLGSVWAICVVAGQLERPGHTLAWQAGVAFLLWRTWRGRTWGLFLLRAQAAVGVLEAALMIFPIARGASDWHVTSFWSGVLYAMTGLVLAQPAITALRAHAVT